MGPNNAHLRKVLDDELRFYAISGLPGELSDSILEDMVAAANGEKVATVLDKYKLAVEEMIGAILNDLHSRAQSGLLEQLCFCAQITV